MSDASAAVREDIGLPREAYSLLAQANLLRMRGCWDEAVQNCMSALRLAPDSPSAQSLLGDIYENQGRVDDAIQWYLMALDANPNSPADRLKLSRLLERQQAPQQAFEGEGKSVKNAIRTPVSRSLSPLERLRQITRDPETALRYTAMIAAMLVMFTVAFAYGAVHHRAALAALGLSNATEVQIKPVVVPPSSAPQADAAPSTQRDAAEQTILESLRRDAGLMASGSSVIDVQLDPRANRLTVTFGLKSDGSLSRAALLHSALQVLQDAAPSQSQHRRIHGSLPRASCFSRQCRRLVSCIHWGFTRSIPACADRPGAR